MKGFALVLLDVEEDTFEMTLVHQVRRQSGIGEHGTKLLVIPIDLPQDGIEPQKILGEPFELDMLECVNSLRVIGTFATP